MMEKILRFLFDYQKFEKDPDLSSVISDTHSKYDKRGSNIIPLRDEDMGLVSAAGDFNTGINTDKPPETADDPGSGNPK